MSKAVGYESHVAAFLAEPERYLNPSLEESSMDALVSGDFHAASERFTQMADEAELIGDTIAARSNRELSNYMLSCHTKVQNIADTPDAYVAYLERRGPIKGNDDTEQWSPSAIAYRLGSGFFTGLILSMPADSLTSYHSAATDISFAAGALAGFLLSTPPSTPRHIP